MIQGGLFGSLNKPSSGATNSTNIQPPKQHVKPQNSLFKQGQNNSFGATQPDPFNKNSQSSQQKPQAQPHFGTLDTKNGIFQHKKTEKSGSSIFTSEQNLLNKNQKNDSTISGAPSSGKGQSNLSSINKLKKNSMTGRYIKNYNANNFFDIQNYYYKFCEVPEQVQQEFIPKLTTILKTLFKQNKQDKKTYSYNPDKIKFGELENVPQQYKKIIQQFWLLIIKQFVQMSHSYCSFEGVISLAQFHIQQNHDIYYPNGQYNLQPFLESIENYDQNIRTLNNSISINLNSHFVISVLQQLSNCLLLFMNHLQSIISVIPKDMVAKHLKNQQIVGNIFYCIKIVYNIDYSFHSQNKFVRQRVCLGLLSTLMTIYGKNPDIFKPNFVKQFIQFVDKNIQFISPGFSISSLNLDQKQFKLVRKCIKFLNVLLFISPYRLETWDPQIKKALALIKSRNLTPLKWMLDAKKNGKSVNQSRFKQSPYRSENQFQNTAPYFPIVGSQWLLLLNNLIKNQSSSVSLNQGYKNTIFYHICSIIEEDPIRFWNDAQAFQQIYNQIGQIYYELQRSSPNSLQQSICKGKLCRIMICASGNKLNDINQIPKQLLIKLSKDTLALRTSSVSSSSLNFSQSFIVPSSIVLNNFASTIIAQKQLTRDILFGEILIPYMLGNSYSTVNLSHMDPISLHYFYHNPSYCVYQLLRKIITQNLSSIPYFAQLWGRQMIRNNLIQDTDISDKQLIILFMFKITLQNLQLLNQNDFQLNSDMFNQNFIGNNNIFTHNRNQQIIKSSVFSQVITLFNSLIRGSDHDKQIFQDIVNRLNTNQNIQNIKQTFLKYVIFQSNAKSLALHIESMYEVQFQQLSWCTNVCMPVMYKLLANHEETVARHYANITRISLYNKCLSNKANQYLSQLNVLKINPFHDYLTNQQKNIDSSLIKIPQLIKYSDYVLQFIKWALRINEDNIKLKSFYNVLYANRKFQTLESALKLLQVLIIVYCKYHDQIYFMEKIRRFLSICVINMSQFKALGLAGFNNSISHPPQIYISNKKVATIPSCLTYLIIDSSASRQNNLTESQVLRSNQIRLTALNILTLITINLSSPISNLLLMQSNSNEQISLPNFDPISTLDFSIYKQFFSDDQQKIYTSAKQLLQTHIKTQLCKTLTQNRQVSPLTWYQFSYTYGQYVDLMAHSKKSLFTCEKVRTAIQRKIYQQRQNGENLSIQMRKIFNKIYGDVHNATRRTIPGYLVDYLCDREVAAYSRYILQLCIKIQPPNANEQEHILKVFTVVLDKLLVMIIQQPQSQIKSTAVQSISINIWKSIRILQTKKGNNYLDFFTKIIVKFMPFILHYYHTNISTLQYVRQYLDSFRLILACKEYLSKQQYQKVISVEKLKQMLLKLMEQTAQKQEFYTILLYTANFYVNLVNTNNSNYKQELYSIYKIVNETINPSFTSKSNIVSNNSNLSSNNSIKKQKNQLNKDVTVISLIMFFKLHIGQQIRNRETTSKNLFNFLTQFNSSSQSSSFASLEGRMVSSTTFNLQSLLLNLKPENSDNSNQFFEISLKIANNPQHFLQVVSACHNMYRMLSHRQAYMGDSQRNLQIQKIFSFVQKVLELQPRSQLLQRKLIYLKCWACNLLYLMTSNCSQPMLLKISHYLISKNNLNVLLGQLLTLYSQSQVMPTSSTNNSSISKLGLLQKQLLLSIMKVYSALIARSQEWNKKSLLGSQDIAKKNSYFNLCKMFVNASKILSKNSKNYTSTSMNQQSKNTLNFNSLVLPSTSVAKTDYQQGIQKISLQSVYLSIMRQKSLQSQPSKLLILHSQSSSILDVIHDHLNLLISQNFLMILVGCYSNTELILDRYQFNEIINIFEIVSKRIYEANNCKSKSYQQFLEQVGKKVWNSTKMSINLFYLNLIQQPLQDQLELLNNIAQLCVNCLLNLNQSMKRLQDYAQFHEKTSQLFKTARKSQKMYKFDIKGYMEQGGFQGRSQYGASYMMSPSTNRYSATYKI